MLDYKKDESRWTETTYVPPVDLTRYITALEFTMYNGDGQKIFTCLNRRHSYTDDFDDQYKDMKDDLLVKRSQTYKLLFFLTLGGWKEKGGKKVWNILGIPMLKRRKIAKDGSIKYYLFGFLPIIKISPKTELPQI